MGRLRLGARDASRCSLPQFVRDAGRADERDAALRRARARRSSRSPARTGLPLELIELGPSAGLNLVFDRYSRTATPRARSATPTRGSSFDATERGRGPARTCSRRRSRSGAGAGIDLAPIDVTTEDGVTLLRSFLWPGLAERATRLDAAIETFRHAPHPPELIRGDYVDLLPGLLAERPDDALTVVFQTASTGYLPEERYDHAPCRARRCRSRRSAACLGVVTAPPGERDGRRARRLGARAACLARTGRRLVALVDFHGNWLDWLDP